LSFFFNTKNGNSKMMKDNATKAYLRQMTLL